ncbi:MAG: hypothetical protein AB7O67_07670 [Vicinamibacterales bacterium]
MAANHFSMARHGVAAVVFTVAAAVPLVFQGTPCAADAVLAVGAPDGLIQPLLGLNIGPKGNLDNPDLTRAYQARGIRLIRTHDYYGPLDMSQMYPDRGRDPHASSSFNFTGALGAERRSSDETFAAILEGGFEPYFRLGDSYNDPKPPSSGELDNFVEASVSVLRHYREALWGGFTSDFRYVEIWNEPNGLLFWSRTPGEYYDLYVRTAFALREAFPGLRVGGPALNPAGCLSAEGRRWTEAFLDRVVAAGAPLDFFSWHMYSNDPADYATCAAYYRAALDARGLTGVEQHVTEWNTENADGELGISLRAGAQGAAINTGAWIAMQRAGVTQETFYRGPEPALDFPQFYGMFYADGRPKPVGHAADLWRRMTTYPIRRVISGGAPEFWALAGSNDDGGLAVLVANTTNGTRTWSLDVPTPRSRFVVRTVSDEAEGIAIEATASRTFTIPAYGVQLVSVK